MDTVDRLFDLLNKSGLSQQDFASQIGVKKNAVSRWKTRELQSYTKYLPQIAEALGTTTEYLLTGDGPKQKRAVSDSDTAQNQQAAAPKGSGLPEEFARLFMSLSPENQNAVIAEMLKRQRTQGYPADQVPGER